jgi:Tfp pilus assembly protein PilV
MLHYILQDWIQSSFFRFFAPSEYSYRELFWHLSMSTVCYFYTMNFPCTYVRPYQIISGLMRLWYCCKHEHMDAVESAESFPAWNKIVAHAVVEYCVVSTSAGYPICDYFVPRKWQAWKNSMYATNFALYVKKIIQKPSKLCYLCWRCSCLGRTLMSKTWRCEWCERDMSMNNCLWSCKHVENFIWASSDQFERQSEHA